MKAAIFILVACLVALGVGLLYQHNKRVELEKVKQATENDLITYSNNFHDTRAKLYEQHEVAKVLESNLSQRKDELASLSNNYAKVTTDFAKAQKEYQAAAEAAKAEMAKRDARINELETQRDDLTKKIDGLNISISGLDKLIADTEKKLAASEGDREFLLKELKRMQAEKAELERQFNDLSALRTQVAKLKDELSIARRLEWIRMGIYGFQEKKGAQLLMSGSTPPSAKTNFGLNVELKQDGTATVVPARTNANATPTGAK